MSKIGDFNIAMTEKVNELGYETVEEAIADGWDSNEFYMSYMKEARDEQEKAHEAWLKEREQVLGELISVYNDIDVPKDCKSYIKHAIELIKKGEI